MLLSISGLIVVALGQAATLGARTEQREALPSRAVPGPSRGDQVAECLRALASLAAHEPRTIRGAVAVLNVALDVLVHRLLEPDTTLAEGPVIEIVRNVRHALERVDPDTPLVIGRRGRGLNLAAPTREPGRATWPRAFRQKGRPPTLAEGRASRRVSP